MPGEDHADGGAVDVGLGLRPDLTGRALGLGFMLAGLEFARRRFAPDGFRLSVAAFNERTRSWSTSAPASGEQRSSRTAPTTASIPFC
jgi:hypothetical protein